MWTVLYGLDLFALLLFVISYWRTCYRRGYRLDPWHLNLFFVFVLPNLIMLPMARNELNGIVLGPDYQAVMAALPTVFAITLVGFFSILAGGSLWRLRLGIGLRNSVMPILEFPFHCSMMMMASRKVLVVQSLACLFLQALILSIYFSQNGFGFDLRLYTFVHPALRPLALLASNYSIIVGSHCFARFAEKKEKILLACTILLSVGLVFFGARSNILNLYLGVLVLNLIRLRTRVNLLKIVGYGFLGLLAMLYLGSVRGGHYSLSLFFSGLIFSIFFGNTFSDLRDFAWVYSAWNHDFWAGKTYLAAIMSFIPRVASGFRDTWSLGAATAATVGFDPQVHPGLRPGIFGEGFFNFGLPGVVAVGLMLGIVFRRVDIDVKRSFSGPHPSMMRAFASNTVTTVAGAFALSAGFSGLYMLACFFVVSWVCLSVVRLVFPRQQPAS